MNEKRSALDALTVDDALVMADQLIRSAEGFTEAAAMPARTATGRRMGRAWAELAEQRAEALRALAQTKAIAVDGEIDGILAATRQDEGQRVLERHADDIAMLKARRLARAGQSASVAERNLIS